MWRICRIFPSRWPSHGKHGHALKLSIPIFSNSKVQTLFHVHPFYFISKEINIIRYGSECDFVEIMCCLSRFIKLN
jgi:hypothetical protein